MKTFDCVSESSAAAKLGVNIPLLYCVTSCDKDDRHYSREDEANVSVKCKGVRLGQ